MMTNTGGETEARSSEVTCSCPFCPPLCSTTLVPARSGLCSPLPGVDPLLPVPSWSLSTCLSGTARNSCAGQPPPRAALCHVPTAPASQLSWAADPRKLPGPGAWALAAPSMPRRPHVYPGGLAVQQEGWRDSGPRLLEGPPFVGIRVTPFKSRFKCMCTLEL